MKRLYLERVDEYFVDDIHKLVFRDEAKMVIVCSRTKLKARQHYNIDIEKCELLKDGLYQIEDIRTVMGE